MVKFSGTIPKHIQKRVVACRNVRRATFVVLVNLLLMALVCILLFKFYPKAVSIVLGLWGVALILEIAPFCITLVNPEKREVNVSEREIVILTPVYFGEEIKIDLKDVEKVIDFGEFYLLKYEKGKREIICAKELLVEGTIEEFESLFKEILIRKKLRPSKRNPEKRKKKDEDLSMEKALIVFEGYNSVKVMGNAELHENRKAAFLFFFIGAISIGVAIYDLIVGNKTDTISFFLAAVLFCFMGATFWNLKAAGVIPPRHRIVITKDTVFDVHLFLDTVRKQKVAKVKKVVDYGSFYEIRGFTKKSIVCEKSLLIKGSLDEFEELFQKKLKVRRG